MAIVSDLVTPFSEALGRLTNTQTGRICLAVSGGPDSLALLLLAHQVASGRIVAVTVDHGLRDEAAGEALFVASLCKRLNVQHAILEPDAPITGNLQSSARAARYALLEKFADKQDCSWIATAHHEDDQVETFLMRLARGSGVDGLAAIRAVNGRIIRPLLEYSKQQLEHICASAGITPIRDPSNDDESFDRVRMRRWLANSKLPFAGDALGKSASALADASHALGWVTEQLAADRIEKHDDMLVFTASDLPLELQRRLLLHALAIMQPAIVPRGETLGQAIAKVSGGGKAMVGECLITGGQSWKIEKSPPRRTT